VVILHVLAPAAVGGLERVVQALAAGQEARGHRVAAALVIERENGNDQHRVVAGLQERGLEVFPIRVGRRAYLAERAALTSVCTKLRPDICHTHGYRADVIDAGVARRKGIPTITTVHGFTGGGWRNRMYERIQRRAFRRFDAVVAVSAPLGVALEREGVPPRFLHVIRNAWDGAITFLDRGAARLELGVPQDGLRIGWAGRVSREKGPDVLLDAVGELRDPAIALSMLGDGPARTRLQLRAEELAVAGQVAWHGAIPDAARLFPAFDAFVLSSRTEGTPMVLFEAMAAGVPVVATAVGGVPDVVSPAEALLVPPDDPAAIAAAVREVLRNPMAARARADNARRRLGREFALDPWLIRYEALYRSLQSARRTCMKS
jgi:glycosyltransferase involved in cell wall biosynthesis